jgi:hypothetical protein
MYWGGDDIFIHPPDLIELVGEASNELLARDGARSVRPIRPSPGQSSAFGVWWPLEGGGIRLLWGDWLSGVEIILQRHGAGYAGTAETYWDFGRPTQSAIVAMNSVSCEGSPHAPGAVHAFPPQ